MICTGERPSADKLVGRLGGSKTTAVSALRAFWSTDLPRRMQAQHVVPPTEIHSLAVRVWTDALQLARTEADATQAAVRASLEAERAELQAQRLALAHADQTHAAVLASVRVEAAQEAVAARELRNRVITLESVLKDLRDERDRLIRTADSLEVLVVKRGEAMSELRFQVAATQEAHREAERLLASLQKDLADARATADRVPDLEQRLRRMQERAEAGVLEVTSLMAAQSRAALNAIEESNRTAVETLLLQLDAARSEAARIRETSAATEMDLRQRIEELESAASAEKPKR